MKIIERPILSFQKNSFFTPIRSKVDYAMVLLLAARQLLLEPPVDDGKADSTASVKLVVDRMSRLFFFQKDKYYSIGFPIIVKVTKENFVEEFTTLGGRVIDNQTISAAISVLNDIQNGNSPSIIDLYIESGINDSVGIFLVEEIFQFEPSYIRYDCDPNNVNGKIHPLHHIDVNYSQNSTYKLGLENAISNDYFQNLQNIRTDCAFLI